jgi:hypothetical protein
MANIQCLVCGKVFKGEPGRGWHMARAHGDLPMTQSASPRAVQCSLSARQFISQVEAKTGLNTEEALDLLIACALNDQVLEPVLDIWDPSESGAENAPFWLPLLDRDYQGKLIIL